MELAIERCVMMYFRQKITKKSAQLDTVFNFGESNVAHNGYQVNKKLLRKVRQLPQ